MAWLIVTGELIKPVKRECMMVKKRGLKDKKIKRAFKTRT